MFVLSSLLSLSYKSHILYYTIYYVSSIYLVYIGESDIEIKRYICLTEIQTPLYYLYHLLLGETFVHTDVDTAIL